MGEWQFCREVLAAYRDAVVDDTLGPALERAIAQVQAAGDYEIGGAHYKTVPRGYDVDHPRAELLKYNGLWAHASGLSREASRRPSLVELCAGHAERMAPLFRWLVRLRREGLRFGQLPAISNAGHTMRAEFTASSQNY